MKNKMNTLTKAILTACCLLLLNISIKAQSNTVTIGNMNTNYVTALSPFDNYYNYSWADNIYLTTDIGQAGKITQIAFYVYEGTTYSMGNQQILMRETSSSSFSSSSYPGTSGFTSVFNGTISYNFSGGNGWQVITLTTPFQYDGLSNLEVLTLNQSGTYTNSYNFFDVTTGYSNNRMRTDYNDASFPSSCVNCGSYTNLTNIQLTMVCTSTMTVSPSSATICNGNSTSLSASGESTYAWSPSTGLSGTTGASVTANPTVTTVYTVAGTDASSCTQTKTVTVTVNPLPTISVSPSTPTICIGSSTTLTASGATSYAWSPNTGLSATTGASVTANPTSTTTYTVTGTGSNGCTKSQTVVVTVNPAPSLTFSPSSPAVCIGNATTVTASGATSYTWSPSTGLNTTSGATVSANPSVTTVYSINATGSNGCTGTQSLTVTINPLPTLTLSPSSPAVCNGSTTTLTATGATTYSWSPATNLSATTGASITANPTTATNYTLTGTNSNGCVNTKAFSIAVNALPSLSINPSSATICTGTSTNLTASGATTYTWSPSTGLSATTGSAITANPTATQTYSISGTNANGCVGTTTVTVNVNPLPTLNISATPTAICIGASSNLTVSGATTYTWSPSTGLNNTNTANVTANPNTTTLYTASGTNSNGCVGTQTINLIVNPLPNLSINPSTPIVLGGQGPTITANGANTYSWSPATNLSSTSGNTVTANPQITTNYTLTGTSSAGCVSNDIFSVGVELWQQTADTFHAPIYYNGNVGIGTNNPTAALDVVGNAIVTGTLTTGGLNSTSSNLNVTTPAIFTNTVTVSTLSVTGGATFDSLGVGQRLNFSQGTEGISFKKDTSSNNQNVLFFGNSSQATQYTARQPTSRFCSALPINTTNHFFLDNITVGNGLASNVSYVAPLGPRYLDILVSNAGATIDLGSSVNTDMLFINSSCGKSVAICAGGSGQVAIGTSSPAPGSILDISNGNSYHTFFLTQAGAGSYNPLVQTGDNAIIWDDNTGGYPNANSKGFVIGAWDNVSPTAGIRIGANGAITIPELNTSHISSTGPYQPLLVDANGLLVSNIQAVAEGGLAGTSWVLGGNCCTNNLFPNNAIGTSDASDLVFISGGNATSNERMRITSGGQIFVGLPRPNGYNVAGNQALNVFGGINTTALYVTDPASKWSDFVFDNNYKLMPLNELEIFYKKNHHLPSVPTTKEIQENGNNIAETEAILLQKIEENTLYIVQQQKQLEEQKKEIAELKALIKKNNK